MILEQLSRNYLQAQLVLRSGPDSFSIDEANVAQDDALPAAPEADAADEC